MRLVIVRHGESEWNRIGRYQGHYDAPLSEMGVRQAEALAERLRTEKFHTIYASPLQRARLTGEAVHRFHPDTPFVIAPAIIELDHGEWSGLMVDEVIEKFGDGLREWRMHPTRSQMPGGESFSNILKRVLDFKEQLLKAHPDQTVLISTHDVVVKILVADALGMHMDGINQIWVTNASISVIEYGSDMTYLVSLSEAAHLSKLEVVRGAW
jgi:broad specificity phosphatase PhoE